MKSESQLALNWFNFNLFNSFGLTDFGLALFCFCWQDIFLSKNLVYMNLTSFFSGEFYTKTQEFWVHSAYDHYYMFLKF